MALGMGDLEQLLAHLRAAREPADVFGAVHSADDLSRAYRRAAKTCHPDLHPAHPDLARDAFVRLTHWYEIAREQLGGTRDPRSAVSAASGRRGDDPAPTTLLHHRDRVYEVDSAVAFAGDFANVYRAVHRAEPVAVKVARRPQDNDLLIAEREALTRLATHVEPRLRPYFPRPVDAFTQEDAATGARRATNVLSWVSGAYTLDEIRRASPTGVGPKDVTWIWRRLLVALGAAHRAGLVHGAVLPPHVCVLPKEHGLVLIGWTCAVETAIPTAIPAISGAYERWYPKEVMSKEPATPATDIALAAHCMIFLLGDSRDSAPRNHAPSEDAPAALSRFFRGCMLPSPRQRPQDAWELLREFDALLARVWGPRRFHHFAVPAPCPR